MQKLDLSRLLVSHLCKNCVCESERGSIPCVSLLSLSLTLYRRHSDAYNRKREGQICICLVRNRGYRVSSSVFLSMSALTCYRSAPRTHPCLSVFSAQLSQCCPRFDCRPSCPTCEMFSVSSRSWARSSFCL